MWKILIVTTFFGALSLAHAEIFQDRLVERILKTNRYTEAVNLVTAAKDDVLRKLKQQRKPVEGITAMLNDVIRKSKTTENCSEVVATFKLSYYDYRDQETYPQKEVTQLSQLLDHLCMLYRRGN